MLRTETVSPELLKVLRQLMEIETLKTFRLVGGSALALQLGHRESLDIDLFPSKDFPTDPISDELIEKLHPEEGIQVAKDVMIKFRYHGVKVDIVNDKKKFIREPVIAEGIRMAHPEDIAATKLYITCDPFNGRKTKKDIVDIAVLLDIYPLKKIIEFFKEKFPNSAPYTHNVILLLNRFDGAENTIMPKMFNGMTWEDAKQKILAGLKDYFDEIIREREEVLRRKSQG